MWKGVFTSPWGRYMASSGRLGGHSRYLRVYRAAALGGHELRGIARCRLYTPIEHMIRFIALLKRTNPFLFVGNYRTSQSARSIRLKRRNFGILHKEFVDESLLLVVSPATHIPTRLFCRFSTADVINPQE